MFCPKCGSILIPKKEEAQALLVCSCGYKSSDTESRKIKETVKKTARRVEVIEKEENWNIMPKINAECPKCHNNEAYFWEVQTRAADEPATKFLKCTRCRHIWRDYN